MKKLANWSEQNSLNPENDVNGCNGVYAILRLGILLTNFVSGQLKPISILGHADRVDNTALTVIRTRAAQDIAWDVTMDSQNDSQRHGKIRYEMAYRKAPKTKK